MQGICKLCGQERDLRISHVIPNFVTRRQLKSSPTKGLRDSRKPNRRIQDGEKLPLLCEECEQLFSKDEHLFAKGIFFPIHQDDPGPFEYEEWALRFGVSLAWRCLVYQGDPGLAHLSADQLASVHKAERVWREFLLGKRSNPGLNEVHLIPLAVIDSYEGGDPSPYINRYILNTTSCDIIQKGTEVLVYVKIGRILLIAFVNAESRGTWRSSLLKLKRGTVDTKQSHVLPMAVGMYINDQAAVLERSIALLSEEQRKKISASLLANVDAAAESDVFRAIQADVGLSGREAFRASSVRND